MPGSYDISNDDMRYVLCTFVVMPPGVRRPRRPVRPIGPSAVE